MSSGTGVEYKRPINIGELKPSTNSIIKDNKKRDMKLGKYQPVKVHKIKVCRCPVCYLQGGKEVLEAIKRILGINRWGISKDGKYSLEVVNGLGRPPLHPVIMVDNEYYTNVTPKKVIELFSKLENK